MPRLPRPLAYGLAGSLLLGTLAVPGVGYAAYQTAAAAAADGG